MRWLALACVFGWLFATTAHAHPLSPAAVLLRERATHRYQLEFRRPGRGVAQLSLALPSRCSRGPEQLSAQGDELVSKSEVVCSAPLVGQKLTLRGFGTSELSAIVHVQYRNGESVRALLSAARSELTIPERSSSASVLGEFVMLGMEHMLAGFDHLLFTAGLLLVGRLRRALLLLTAFTLGHSITLALVALLGWSLPRAPVELGIALTLVGLALTVVQRAESERTQPERSLLSAAALTLAVGLLHGLGFADGLRALTLPQHALLAALFGFNAGVEVAQIGWVCVLAPVLWLVGHGHARRQRIAHRLLGYAIGGLAAFWCIERAQALL